MLANHKVADSSRFIKSQMKIIPVLATTLLFSSFATMSALAADVTGFSTGTFVNPLPATAITSGVGTNTFNFGTAFDNVGAGQISFESASFSSGFNTPFKLGKLRYFNGTTVNDSEADSVDLSLGLTFTTPSIPTSFSTFNLSLINSPNTSSPDDSADYLFFNGTKTLAPFFIDGISYNVNLTGFGNVVGDGFLTSNSSQFRIREGSSATADLFGVVTVATEVPEPGSLALLGIGLVGLIARRKVKSRNT